MKIKKVQPTNPVAKHSRNKSGAGAHKSAKDYSRKTKHKNESLANKFDRLILLQQIQKNSHSGERIWFDCEEQIIELKQEIEDWQTTE